MCKSCYKWSYEIAVQMNSVLAILEPLLILIILDGLFEHLNHSEIQLLAAVTAGLAGASRHHGELPKQLFWGDVWLSPPFVLRDAFQGGKMLARRRTDSPGRWSQRVYPVIHPLGLLPIFPFNALTLQDVCNHSANALLISGALLSLLICALALTSRLNLCVRSTRPVLFRTYCCASTGAL